MRKVVKIVGMNPEISLDKVEKFHPDERKSFDFQKRYSCGAKRCSATERSGPCMLKEIGILSLCCISLYFDCHMGKSNARTPILL